MIRKYASAGRLPKRVRYTTSLRFFSLLSYSCSTALLGNMGTGNEVKGVHMGEPDASLKVLQSISSIREDLEAYVEKPLREDGRIGRP